MSAIIEKIRKQIEENSNLELEIENFICKDWKVYYNLYNPENFQDPENPPEWYDVSEVYTYNEIPFSSENIKIYSPEKNQNFQVILELIENSHTMESKILNGIVHYTFGNGGTYADCKHYNYAKKTMELLHNISFTNEEFIKRNLRLHTIELGREIDELILHFDCSWNEEHGLTIYLKNNEVFSFE